MSSQSKPVPWKNWDEWIEVYELLFSENENEILKGCAIVSAWATKRDIPISIEVTADLQRELHHNRNVNALSLAVIRFINGLIEPYKNTNIASSIQRIGEQCNIPEHIISIRHLATHGKLPTFEFAAAGAVSALIYLKKYYWSEQYNLIMQSRANAREEIMIYLNSGKIPFQNLPNNIILAFGMPELLKFITNENESSVKTYGWKVIDLLHNLDRIPDLGQSFCSSLFELAHEGNQSAIAWYEFISKSFPIPDNLLNWTPLEDSGVVDDWPDCSIGNLPFNNQQLSLDQEDIDFVDPLDE
ncbi:Las1-like family protein [Trichomonas vaginalis G3]|uniref:Las1-like family protein n=1 Tax=Trichomonas vaginalis (strain ATCC PRA-98 / G3) TaxID=412133 RepID=A2G3K5_TRIV3|nr:endonucleolytic cleavage involved in rRNA processing [Trichomonas vaginalis G3]EAX88265.1 Las1-like family protein [Trichomonas vaginalis G3]KAI5487942.1 endonucleolytic cleavage involved in rRNA processing [Trichomonas vaginalis G3]|eukprot:XP_001301195.1 Las1-like family protein [Trichomonas vaginalis G3]